MCVRAMECAGLVVALPVFVWRTQQVVTRHQGCVMRLKMWAAILPGPERPCMI